MYVPWSPSYDLTEKEKRDPDGALVGPLLGVLYYPARRVQRVLLVRIVGKDVLS
jgi:hypothetical protein